MKGIPSAVKFFKNYLWSVFEKCRNINEPLTRLLVMAIFICVLIFVAWCFGVLGTLVEFATTVWSTIGHFVVRLASFTYEMVHRIFFNEPPVPMYQHVLNNLIGLVLTIVNSKMSFDTFCN